MICSLLPTLSRVGALSGGFRSALGLRSLRLWFSVLAVRSKFAPSFSVGPLFPSCNFFVVCVSSCPIFCDGMPTKNNSFPTGIVCLPNALRGFASATPSLPHLSFHASLLPWSSCLGNCSGTMARCDVALRLWGRHLVEVAVRFTFMFCVVRVWMAGYPWHFAWALTCNLRRDNVFSESSSLPIPAAAFATARQNPGTCFHWCQCVRNIGSPADHVVGPRCSPVLSLRLLRSTSV